MNRFEKTFGKYAIRNLSLVLIICYAFGFLIEQTNPDFINYLSLNPYMILHGQVWRLLTWIIIPPESSNVFFMLIMLLFYFSIGTTLERVWGTYRFNCYIFSGIGMTIIGAFLMMGYTYLFHGSDILAVFGEEYFFRIVSMAFSTYYINMSIFLAYAATFPDAGVLLFFFIPIKVKWLGIVYGAMVVYELVICLMQGAYYVAFAIIASLANFVIFILSSGRFSHLSPSEIRRRQEFARAVNGAGNRRDTSSAAGRPQETVKMRTPYRHKCAICGRTDVSAPNLDFRYCSKCEGTYEFCQDHLFTHVHAAGGKGPGLNTASEAPAKEPETGNEEADHEQIQ